jgi:hypothetical protein
MALAGDGDIEAICGRLLFRWIDDSGINTASPAWTRAQTNNIKRRSAFFRRIILELRDPDDIEHVQGISFGPPIHELGSDDLITWHVLPNCVTPLDFMAFLDNFLSVSSVSSDQLPNGVMPGRKEQLLDVVHSCWLCQCPPQVLPAPDRIRSIEDQILVESPNVDLARTLTIPDSNPRHCWSIPGDAVEPKLALELANITLILGWEAAFRKYFAIALWTSQSGQGSLILDTPVAELRDLRGSHPFPND